MCFKEVTKKKKEVTITMKELPVWNFCLHLVGEKMFPYFGKVVISLYCIYIESNFIMAFRFNK